MEFSNCRVGVIVKYQLNNDVVENLTVILVCACVNVTTEIINLVGGKKIQSFGRLQSNMLSKRVCKWHHGGQNAD